MNTPQRIAKQLRDVYFGGNWTAISLKDKLADLTWQQATEKVYSFHAIATLVFHMNYFVDAILKVLRGGPLDAKDKFSFDNPPICSQEDWEALLTKTWTDAEDLACLIEELPEHQLWEDFVEQKYGAYYRNLHGIIEHNHYHLGQISIIRRILMQSDESGHLGES